ncbi:MAG: glycosyltransferase family 2 protein [Rikenellaceae bacterium]
MIESHNSQPRSAVVILNWNGVAHLQQFLPSVVRNTPEWVDIVIADNGSTDESCEFVEQRFSDRVQLVRLERNWGFAEGYNRALAELHHEIFILLNSDVEVSEGWCELLIEELTPKAESNEAPVGIVSPKIRSYTERDKFEAAGASGGFIDYLGYPFCRGRVLSTIEQDKGQYDDARDLFWVSGAAFGCRGDLYRKLGGFEGSFFAHQEEIDLCWRAQLIGYRVRIIPQSVVFHLGGGTLSKESPRKTMLNHRNNLAMLYRCAPTHQRIVVALLRPLLDLAAAFSYLIGGKFRSALAVFEAWRDFISWHSHLNAQRRKIRNLVVAESRYIYKGSILLHRLFCGGRCPRV